MDTDEELPDIPACISCGFEIDNPDDVGYTSDDEPVCDDCRWMCEKCESIYSALTDKNVIDGNEVWCQGCTDHYAYWCDICEQLTSQDTHMAQMIAIYFL
jgi:hypothetical protein